eukprot:63565-Rhodomonas_salina.1
MDALLAELACCTPRSRMIPRKNAGGWKAEAPSTDTDTETQTQTQTQTQTEPARDPSPGH